MILKQDSEHSGKTSPWFQSLDILYDFTPEDIEEMTRVAKLIIEENERMNKHGAIKR